jgi:hypothetical protein
MGVSRNQLTGDRDQLTFRLGLRLGSWYLQMLTGCPMAPTLPTERIGKESYRALWSCKLGMAVCMRICILLDDGNKYRHCLESRIITAEWNILVADSPCALRYYLPLYSLSSGTNRGNVCRLWWEILGIEQSARRYV